MKEKIVLDFSKRKKKGGMVIMGKKENKTNALRLLEQAGIGYDLHEFNVDEKILDHQINNNSENVYKTLVLCAWWMFTSRTEEIISDFYRSKLFEI